MLAAMVVLANPPTPREFLMGCVTVVGLGVAGLYVLGLATCALLDHEVAKGRLPSSIEISEVTAVSQTSDGREACVYAAYEIKPESAARLQREGLPALWGGQTPTGGWRSTPLLIEAGGRAKFNIDEASFPLFALNANGGCIRRPKRPVDAERLLRMPGSFYSITPNREGLVVINPESATAAFLYYG